MSLRLLIEWIGVISTSQRLDPCGSSVLYPLLQTETADAPQLWFYCLWPASLGADLKTGGGDGLLMPFFLLLPSPSLHRSLSFCVCLIEPTWCLLDELIPRLRFWSLWNKSLHLWIGHMALVGGLWSIHSNFGCICTSYKASTLRLIYHHSEATRTFSPYITQVLNTFMNP